jgi:hypothetical protein
MMQAFPARAALALCLLVPLLPAQGSLGTTASPSDLLARLPASKALVERGGDLRWEVQGGPSFRVLDASDGLAVLDAGGRRLSVAASVLVHEAEVAVRRLPELLRLADAAGLDVATLSYRRAPLLGAHLKNDDVAVVPEGVARRVEIEAYDGRELTRALRQAGKDLAAVADQAKVNTAAQAALRRFVGNLHLRDAQIDRESGALPASAARQMVRHGWLAGFGLEPTAVRTVVDAVASAEALRASKRYTGDDGLEIAELGNAFGRAGVSLRSKVRSGYVVEAPEPQFFDRPSGLGVAVTLPPSADPRDPAAEILAAETWFGDLVLTRWSRDTGFWADAGAWQAALPDSVRQARGDLLPGLLPPHVLARTLAGDVRFLATAHGVLVPPKDPGSAEGERFLTDASKVLPDAAHLDLIGNYLFRYAFDSPDPRFPLLVGDQSLNGEIHQDAQQTLATVTGGIVRGDCDDLAELYLRILERQGKHGHLMSLPRHCAVCWVERGDGEFIARVLQTGPGMQFTAPELSKVLSLAYQEFSGGDVVDPNQLGILLRFSGENIRTPYVLGWRIFGDPKYSEVMVDVQRDWHFHTYRNGYEKMQALVAAGDEDNANFRELSGLCQSTGQFAASAEYLAQALARVREPDAAVNLAIERMSDLFECGQPEAGRALAADIIDQQLPAAEAALGPALPSMAMQLIGRLLGHDGNVDLAARALQTYVAKTAKERLVLCYRYVNSKSFDANEWATSPVLLQSRDLLRTFTGSLIECLEQGDLATLPKLADEMETADNWIMALAFRAPVEPSDVLEAYALQGRLWRALLGEARFGELLARVALPRGKPPTEQRGSGFSQLLADLPWIKTSVDYHFSTLSQMFGRRAQGYDQTRALALVDAVLAARERATELGLFQPRQELFVALARFTKALLTEDDAGVRAHLQFVREQNDKMLRDLTTRWLGDAAPVLPLPWFARVLTAWREIVDFKPSYFGIAWGAVLVRAPEHALAAGKMAAERYPEDPAFVAEYAFLRKQLGKD